MAKLIWIALASKNDKYPEVFGEFHAFYRLLTRVEVSDCQINPNSERSKHGVLPLDIILGKFRKGGCSYNFFCRVIRLPYTVSDVHFSFHVQPTTNMHTESLNANAKDLGCLSSVSNNLNRKSWTIILNLSINKVQR